MCTCVLSFSVLVVLHLLADKAQIIGLILLVFISLPKWSDINGNIIAQVYTFG